MTTETTWQPHDKHGRLTRQSDLPDTVFAFPGQRREPLTDANHVRGAVARFDQVIGVSDADRALAFANIQQAARYYALNLPETDWHRLGVHPRQNGKAAAAKAAATVAPEGPRSLAVRDRPCIDCLEEAAPSRKTGVTVRPGAFWLVAYLFGVVMLGQTIPTPLYVLYQARWHFSSGIVTLVFAANAAAVLAALLLAGRVSDQVGRRPVLAASLGFGALGTVVFILAPNLGWLFAGRVLFGLAAGLVTGTATATLAESARNARRSSQVATAAQTGGLALGPLIAGLFAEYGPHPTVLVFEVYLGILALAAAALLLCPETVADRTPLSLRFQGLAIPKAGRPEFLAASLAGFAAFALLGLFTALAPSFLGQVLHERNHAVDGAVVFALYASATVTQVLLARFNSRPVVLSGLATFLVSLALIVAGLSAASMVLFVVGTVVGGVGVGAVFLGSLSTANRLAPAAQRGRVLSTFFVFCYIGLAIPVIGVGFASADVGDFRAVLVCAIVLAAVSVMSMAGIRRAAPTR
jgi:MFS family permease